MCVLVSMWFKRKKAAFLRLGATHVDLNVNRLFEVRLDKFHCLQQPVKSADSLVHDGLVKSQALSFWQLGKQCTQFFGFHFVAPSKI